MPSNLESQLKKYQKAFTRHKFAEARDGFRQIMMRFPSNTSAKRGFWLSCSKFPKCRGRGGWASIEEEKQKELEAAWKKHVEENPVPDIVNTQGVVIGDEYLPIIESANNTDENDKQD